VQFASAMAVMARTLGIPSRVAVGFLPGKKTADGSYEITLQDAHAWPELYYEGVGWVRFEPTPATRVQSVPPYSVAPETSDATPTPSASTSTAPNSAVPSPRAGIRPDLEPQAVEQPPIGTRIWTAIPWRILGILGLVVLLGLVPAAAALIGRRRRWARATTRFRLAEAAWDDLRERLGDLGVGWATSWTPRALQRRLITDHALGGTEAEAARRLVTDLESARYAPPDDRPARSSGDVRSDVDLVVSGVGLTCSKGTRRRARWFPRSGVESLLRLGRRVDVAAEEAGRRASELGSEVRQKVGSGHR
jgi:hypothetical protein